MVVRVCACPSALEMPCRAEQSACCSLFYVHYLQSWASAYSKHGQNATEALIICCTLLYYLKTCLLSSSQNENVLKFVGVDGYVSSWEHS